MDIDERDTQKVMEAVAQKQNPFDLDCVPRELINIASGQVASKKVAKELVNLLMVENAVFIEQCLTEKNKELLGPREKKPIYKLQVHENTSCS